MGEELPNFPAFISAEQIPEWVSGTMLSESAGRGWKGISQRTYDFHGQDVELPPMDCFKVVQYLRGDTPMDRKIDARWTRTECGPGQFSLLSRATPTQWNWTQSVIVSHVYLSDDLMRRVAMDVQGDRILHVQLRDVLRAVDPVVTFLMEQIAKEAKWDGPAGALYAESLAVQLAVHLLRSYSCSSVPAQTVRHGLSQRQLKTLEDFIAAHLQDPISLEDMAELLGMGVWTFGRRLKLTVGKSACALVQDRRVEKAQSLLANRTAIPIKQIAAACGFSDQAHLTRTFRAKLQVTPAQYRRQT